MSDPRPKETRDRLGDALIALLLEKPFDDIRVQDVLERAGVGRSTFYAHYKDKRDLLVSDYEEFLQMFASTPPGEGRVFAVREFFAHVRDNVQLAGAFERAELLDDLFKMAEGVFARGIEARLPEHTPYRDMKARALSAALLALVRTWKGTPEALDTFFHSLV